MILVESGYGVTLGVEAACQREGRELAMLDIEDDREERKLCLSWKRNGSRMRREYLELIREYYNLEGAPEDREPTE